MFHKQRWEIVEGRPAEERAGEGTSYFLSHSGMFLPQRNVTKAETIQDMVHIKEMDLESSATSRKFCLLFISIW